MASEIEQVAPILTVIDDDGDFIVRASKESGKRLGQLVLSQLPNARKVTFISDADVKVFRNKGNGNGTAGAASHDSPNPLPPDPQQEFERQLEPESNPAPAPPSPPKRRIVQDSAAPPAPELAEDYMEELRKQQQEEAQLRQQQKLNAQPAVTEEATEEPEPAPTKRRTRERNLNVSGFPCGRCGGQGRVIGDAGFEGTCPVCTGSGQIKSWGRGRRVQ